MRILALALLAGLASTSAFAADVVAQEPPAPVAVAEVPIFSWTGGYLGLQGGGLWSNVKVEDEFFDERISNNLNGGMFGPYAGYNWQSGAWVFGAEGDINWTWNKNTVGVFDLAGIDRDVDLKTDYLASLRGRVGYAGFDRTLLFVTGGVAFTEVKAEATIFDNVNLNASKSFTGWTIGAGGEYAFTDNWIGRLEYRYYDFGNNTIEGFDNVKTTTNTVTVGIAYKW